MVTDKNFREIRQEEVRVTIHQRGYLTTLIHKKFELAEKYLLNNYEPPKNIAIKKP